MNHDALSVKIGTMVYHLTADEDPDYIREIANQAHEMISLIKKNNPGMGDQAAAVLALINCLDKCEKMKGTSGDREDQNQKLRLELEECEALCLRIREQAWEYKKDLLYYRNLCEVYEEKLSDQAAKTIPTSARKGIPEKPKPLDRLQRSISDYSNLEQKKL